MESVFFQARQLFPTQSLSGSDSWEVLKRKVEKDDRKLRPGAQAASRSVCGAERGAVDKLHIPLPLNSILNLRAVSGEESRKKRGRPGRAYTAVNEAWFFPSVTMKCQRAFFRGSWFIRILIDCFQGLDWAPAFR